VVSCRGCGYSMRKKEKGLRENEKKKEGRG
jgi:Zn ribbon nucleic-acid-binding protein